jgi:hypothetical protein
MPIAWPQGVFGAATARHVLSDGTASPAEVHLIRGLSSACRVREHVVVFVVERHEPRMVSLLNTLFIRSDLKRMVLRHSRSNQRRPRMKLHRHAKTTPCSRLALVRRDRRW